MRVIPYLLLALPLLASAKSETTSIEIAHKKRPFVTLSGPATAGQFTIWSGPGTAAGPPGEQGQMTTGEGDIADWTAGSIELPQRKLAIFKVRFFCASQPEPPPEVSPEVATSHQCYGVRYAIDPETQQGYIQIPPERDKDFPRNTQTIYRGVEGRWFRSSARWEEVVRPRINETLQVKPVEYNYWQQPYIYTPPASHTAVGARPTVTPKTR